MPSRTYQSPSAPDPMSGMRLVAVVFGVGALGILLVFLALRGGSKPSAGPMTLTPGHPVHRSIARAEDHVYVLSLPAQTAAAIELDQHEIDLVLGAADAQGARLAEIDYGPYGREGLLIRAEQAGAHRVTVHPLPDSTARGRYEIRVSLRPLRPDDADRVRAQDLFAAGRRTSPATAEGLADALDLHGKAAQLWHATGERRAEAAALLNRGIAYDHTGKWEDAYHCYREALALSDALRDEYGRLRTLRQIARLNGHLGQDFSWIPSETEFVRLWEQTGDRRGIAESLSALTGKRLRAAQTDRDSEEGLALGNRTLELFRKLGDIRGERRASEDLVVANSQLKRHGRALELAQRILSLNQAAGDQRGVAASLVRIGTVFDLAMRQRDAIPYYERALPMLRGQGDRSAEQHVYRALVGDLVAEDDPEAALPYAKAALALEVSLRADLKSPKWKEGFSGQKGLITQFTGLLMALDRKSPNRGHSFEAFLAVDHANGRLLHDPAPFAPKRLSDIQALVDENTALVEYGLSGVQQVDAPSSATLSGAPTPGFVWVVTRSSFSVYGIPDRRLIEPLVRQAYDDLSAYDHPGASKTTQGTEALASLSKMLVAPFAAEVSGKNLLIAGGDVLEYVPFAALPDPADPNRRPLIENHQITRIPSAAIALSHKNDSAPSVRPERLLAVLADPVFGRDDPRFRNAVAIAAQNPASPDLVRAAQAVQQGNSVIPRLPYSRREAEWVSQWAPPEKSLKLFDFDADRSALMSGDLRNYRIVHIATHGFVNDEDPDLSGLVLSLVDRDGHPRDGFFRLRDLYSLHLPAELVVLSACQSAVGKVIGGEGLLSLTTGFLRAGAGAVLASTWKVDDQATAEFMKTFYSEMLGPDQRSPSAALQATQNAFMHHPRWHAPRYWAGFTLHARSSKAR